MRVGVPKEIKVHEYRVGLTPASVAELVAAGHEVTGIFVELDVTDAGEYDSGVAPTDYQEVEYKKLTGGSIVLVIGAYEGDDLDDAEDLYNDVMKFFGFDYNAEGKLLDKHFARKAASLYLKDEVAINLYTGSIIQPDPNVIPPKTGDAASFLGFAMIALALAAMGFVVIKKTVRA
jgi:LPXTG-motif cell wall-anchored protein